ncbi:MAG: ABC transporter ATP-binding protein [Opitutaceae bacterium]|jgi:lipopolysaccharide transport system ATP-binding protein|nr:ABC transporter ATP-binding protein [Opitutaceae bacterium]
MNTPILEVDNVSKDYRLWHSPSDRLIAPMLDSMAALPLLPEAWRSRMRRSAEKRARQFQALHPLSFSLRRGESLGIIGRNGAGKSTLLQIIAGTLTPTTGKVSRSGRVAALLELGSGFNLDFTGRENVLLTASLQGMTSREAEQALDAVVSFASIGDFLDQPVKTYSSGMMVRLAFAAQTILEPELFIVDEALAVGDIFFQAQCSRFFKQRLADGMTLLLVSHDLPSVKALCKNAIVLHEGRPVFQGPSAEAVSFFHALHRPGAQATVQAPVRSQTGLQEGERRNWRAGASEAGPRTVEIVAVRLLDSQGRPASVFELGEEITCECVVESSVDSAEMQFSMEVTTRHNFVVFGVSSCHLEMPLFQAIAGEQFLVRYRWTASLGAGEYLVDLAVGLGDRGDGAPLALLHRLGHVAAFSVHHGPFKPRFFGVSDLKPSIEKKDFS